jgi:hypothetical protein
VSRFTPRSPLDAVEWSNALSERCCLLYKLNGGAHQGVQRLRRQESCGAMHPRSPLLLPPLGLSRWASPIPCSAPWRIASSFKKSATSRLVSRSSGGGDGEPLSAGARPPPTPPHLSLHTLASVSTALQTEQQQNRGKAIQLPKNVGLSV